MYLKRHYEPDALAEWLAKRDAEVGPKVNGIVEATGMTESAAEIGAFRYSGEYATS